MPWMRRLGIGLACVLGLLAASAAVAWIWGRPALERWTRSEGFQELMSREVSKALKVDGRFGLITVRGLEATVPTYTSEGWPGEAIGSLQAEGIRAVFNPWAVLRRVWQVDSIHIERGVFTLRLPDDARKRPVVRGKKPWHALFMPARFYCPEIVCPAAQVEFPFQGQTAHLRDLNLRARMVVQDFAYRADAGRLEFPLLPVLEVEDLDLFITRESADIRTARLRGLEGDPARLRLSGRVGMREDRSIRARVEATALPFAQALPGEWAGRVGGRLTGSLEWNTDASGLKTSSDGVVEIEDAGVRDWAWLADLARLHKNRDLAQLAVPRARCAFAFDGQTFRLRQLEAEVGDLAAFRGEVDYTPATGRMGARLVLDRFEVQDWLPDALKPRVRAPGRGDVSWEGDWRDPLAASAAGKLHIPEARYRLRPDFRRVTARYGLVLPEETGIRRLDLHFTQAGRRFDITHLGVEAPGLVEASAYGHWVAGEGWEIHAAFEGLDAARWKPPAGAGRVTGQVAGRLSWSAAAGRPAEGRGGAEVRITGARLRGFAFQDALARLLRADEMRDLRLEEAVVHGVEGLEEGTVEKLRLLAPGKLGIEGTVRLGAGGKVSGTVWVGLPRERLAWLPDADKTVFVRSKEGLLWARVTLGGTTRRLEQDLGTQILRQLRRHPGALFQAGLRALSFWLGNALGTYEPPNE